MTVKTGVVDPAFAHVFRDDKWLRESGENSPQFDAEGIFRNVRRVTFVIALPDHDDVITSNSVESWFASLRRRGARSCYIDFALNLPGTAPFDELLGLAGRGRWQMIVSAPASFEEWRMSWTTTPEGAGVGAGRWDVSGSGLVKGGTQPAGRVALSRAGNDLLTALENVKGFAATQQLTTWSEHFADAIEALRTRTPPQKRVLQMVPSGHPDNAVRLLDVCDRAWVFGGMGSWTDYVFDDANDNNTHKELSRELYQAVLRAVVAAVNRERVAR
jgi:hypothetical protein